MVWSKPALNWFKQLGQTVTHKSKWNQTMQNPNQTKNLINKLESYMSLSNLTPIGYPINSCSMCTFFDNMETQSRMFFFVVPSCWLFFYVINPIHWSCLRNEFCYFSFIFFYEVILAPRPKTYVCQARSVDSGPFLILY